MTLKNIKNNHIYSQPPTTTIVVVQLNIINISNSKTMTVKIIKLLT